MTGSSARVGYLTSEKKEVTLRSAYMVKELRHNKKNVRFIVKKTWNKAPARMYLVLKACLQREKTLRDDHFTHAVNEGRILMRLILSVQ